MDLQQQPKQPFDEGLPLEATQELVKTCKAAARGLFYVLFQLLLICFLCERKRGRERQGERERS